MTIPKKTFSEVSIGELAVMFGLSHFGQTPNTIAGFTSENLLKK